MLCAQALLPFCLFADSVFKRNYFPLLILFDTLSHLELDLKKEILNKYYSNVKTVVKFAVSLNDKTQNLSNYNKGAS